MQRFLLDWLICPQCHAKLQWKVDCEKNGEVEEAQAVCSGCYHSYPVREGIACFLTDMLERTDLWEQSESELLRFLNQNPEIRGQLLYAPPEKLAPADRFYRMMVLEEMGDFSQSNTLETSALQSLYTAEYWACWNKHLDNVATRALQSGSPVLDFASGRGYFIERLVQRGLPNLVATDFSLSVLRRSLRVFQNNYPDASLSFIAMDARQTPFQDQTIPLLTTNLGLGNIQQPRSLLAELRRICSGSLLDIHHFYPAEDEVHAKAFADLKINSMLNEEQLLAEFGQYHWQVELINECYSKSLPTPKSVLLDGATIDTFPLHPVELKWATIRAH